MTRTAKVVIAIAATLLVAFVMVLLVANNLHREAEQKRKEGDHRESQRRLELRDSCRTAVEQYLGGSGSVFDWDKSYILRPGSNVFALENGVRVDIEADTGGNWRKFNCYLGYDGKIQKIFEA